MEESNLEQNPNIQPQNNIPQPQPPVQPVENKTETKIPPSTKSKLPLMLIVIFVLLIILGSGAYYYLGVQKTSNNKACPDIARICKDGSTAIPGPNCALKCSEDLLPKPSSSPLPKETRSDELNPSEAVKILPLTDNWKTYNLTDANFKYPPEWEIISEYTFKGGTNREDFTLKCRGPILQNIQDKTMLIAVESINIKKNPDGGFCWSSGEFKKVSKRTVTSVIPSKEITLSGWIPGILLKYTQNEKSSLIFQAYDFNEFSKTDTAKNWYEFALIYENGKNIIAEQTFDQILSTFKFTNQ